MPCAKENFPRAISVTRALISPTLTSGFCFEFHENTTLI